MGLIPLADGCLVFGAGDPAWSLLDARGKQILGRDPAIADFHRRGHSLRLSHDGTLAEVDFKVLDAHGNWQVHDLVFCQLNIDGYSRLRLIQKSWSYR